MRPARADDLPAMAAIEKLCFSDPWSEASLGEELESLLPPVVAEVSGEIAGYLCQWAALDERHITNLAVHPERRRRGVGRQLLEWAIGAARKAKCQRLILEVRPSNDRARRLYAGLGFVELYRRRRYYIRPSEDGLVLVLSLSTPAPRTEPSDEEDD